MANVYRKQHLAAVSLGQGANVALSTCFRFGLQDDVCCQSGLVLTLAETPWATLKLKGQGDGFCFPDLCDIMHVSLTNQLHNWRKHLETILEPGN